jgi:hypothetical protein
VIAADRAFAGVVGEIAEFGALVERPHRVGRERAEAHRRNIEYRTGVRLLAIFAADLHAEIKIVDLYRTQRMIDPFVAGQVHVFAGAERLSALDVFGALINERTLRTRERHRFVIALEQILTDLRADCLEKESEMREQRIVAQDRMPSLEIIADTNQAQGARGAGDK